MQSRIAITFFQLSFSALFHNVGNSQTYFNKLAVWTPQDFESMFGHFSTLWNKELKNLIRLIRFLIVLKYRWSCKLPTITEFPVSSFHCTSFRNWYWTHIVPKFCLRSSCITGACSKSGFPRRVVVNVLLTSIEKISEGVVLTWTYCLTHVILLWKGSPANGFLRT